MSDVRPRQVASMITYRLRNPDDDLDTYDGPTVILVACTDGSLWYRRTDWDQAKPWRPYEPAIPGATP